MLRYHRVRCSMLLMHLFIFIKLRMYSVKEAAEKLVLGESQVRRLLRSGKIKGKKLACDWVVLSLDCKRKRKPKRR